MSIGINTLPATGYQQTKKPLPKLFIPESSHPLVSVGIPTFNRPVELRRCLHDILRQTYKNLEVIVSDNASNSPMVKQVVAEISANDPRVTFYSQLENYGPVANFQFVLEKANGLFFMWAADDDYRNPDFIEALVSVMVAEPTCAIAFCDFKEVYADGTRALGYPKHLHLINQFTSQVAIIRLLRYFFQLESKGKANLVYGLIKRELLIGFDWRNFVAVHGSYGIDMLFVFHLLSKGRLGVAVGCGYACTVGNVKTYLAATPKTYAQKIVTPFRSLWAQLRYSLRYPLVAEGLTRWILYFFWPVKAVDIFVRLFLIVEFKNMSRRIWKRLCR